MWVEFWRTLTGDEVEYQASYGEARDAVDYITSEGRYRAARAVFQLLARVPGYGWMLWAYLHAPGFAAAAEWAYSRTAAHRSAAYRITRWLWGQRVERPAYRVAAMLFGKALAIIYLIAFVSFGVQAPGLIGSRGILPWGHSDFALAALAWTGAAIAVAAAIARSQSRVQRAAFAALFALYFYAVPAGQIFMGYQWDYLLLEAGFLAIFLTADLQRVWLFQWLLFRLMFESGAVKLQSHDPTWKGLTALTYHYWTQPLPTPLAWYMAQAPLRFQKASAGFVFGVEMALPFLMFGPRRLKQMAACGTALLQVLILLTGNYTFFNWLTIALCLFLLDDTFWGSRWSSLRDTRTAPRANRFVSAALVLGILAVSCTQIAGMFGSRLPGVFRAAEAWAAPFGVVNEYGLFASMTTTRPEISVEGSNDGVQWTPYVFRYKAGPLDRAPAWVAPYQPRLDWQMWFAALGNYPENPWFSAFLMRLLQGSPPVLALLDRDPFAGKPPKYVRAQIYEYRFTDFATRRKTGAWWTREPAGTYFPAAGLRSQAEESDRLNANEE